MMLANLHLWFFAITITLTAYMVVDGVYNRKFWYVGITGALLIVALVGFPLVGAVHLTGVETTFAWALSCLFVLGHSFFSSNNKLSGQLNPVQVGKE